MKKRDNKGFTLIELLAVVVILLAISTIAVSSISAAIERNKEKQNDAKKEVLVGYAKIYYEKNQNSFKNRCSEGQCIITIDELLKSDLNIEDKEIKDADDKRFGGCIIYNIEENTYRYENDGNNC